MEERENDLIQEDNSALKCTGCTINGKDCIIFGNDNFFTYKATGCEINGDRNENWADNATINGNHNKNYGRRVSMTGTGNINFVKHAPQRLVFTSHSSKKGSIKHGGEDEKELEKCKEEIRLLKRALEETQKSNKKPRKEQKEEGECEEKEKEEKKEMEYDENICIICFERNRSCVYIKCGHMVTCTVCGIATNQKCPECRIRGPIKEVYK